MTLMHWAMVLLGLAIGLACMAWTSYRMTNEQLENLRELQSFITRYHKLTDAQYNNLQTYVDGRFDSIIEFTDSLSDIVSRMSRENNENGHKLLDVVKQDHNNKGEMIRAMSTALSEYMEANTERWDLIVDYITNDGQEKAELYGMEETDDD